MDPIEIDTVGAADLDEPVFVEGLPGVGLVGKLAVDHLVGELDSEPVREVYSSYFPPSISVDKQGKATLPALTLHAIDTPERDLLVLAGEAQAQEAVGQYELADAVLDIAGELGVAQIVTIGGYGTGEEVEDYGVLAAAADGSDTLRERLREAGARFDREEGPGNIVGMSGLLVGLGARRGFETAGMLGTTPGYHVDPASARAVLTVLQDAFGFSISLETLDEQAERVQQLIQQLQRLQQQQQPQEQPTTQSEDLRYFG